MDPRPLVDVLETPGLGGQAVYDDDSGLTAGEFNRRLDLSVRHLASLFEQARAERRRQVVISSTAANLDGSGNATFPVYQTAAGFNFFVSRIVVEAAGYTPASPYSNASFYLGLYSSQNPNSVAQGQLLDFTPTLAAAQGIPNVADYLADESGPMVQGQHYLVCNVVSGPASKILTVRYQGYLLAQ